MFSEDQKKINSELIFQHKFLIENSSTYSNFLEMEDNKEIKERFSIHGFFNQYFENKKKLKSQILKLGIIIDSTKAEESVISEVSDDGIFNIEINETVYKVFKLELENSKNSNLFFDNFEANLLDYPKLFKEQRKSFFDFLESSNKHFTEDGRNFIKIKRKINN